MQLSRRQLVQSLTATAVVAPLARAAHAAPTPARLAPAMASIRAYGEAHRRAFNLPALAISVSAPGLPNVIIPLGDKPPAPRRTVGCQAGVPLGFPSGVAANGRNGSKVDLALDGRGPFRASSSGFGGGSLGASAYEHCRTVRNNHA